MKQSKQQLSESLAAPLIKSNKIEDLGNEQLIEIFQNEEGGLGYLPASIGQIDPRSNEMVLFNPSRATRPKDYSQAKSQNDCPICTGETTAILDRAELSQGFTFINKNLFPGIYPHNAKVNTAADGDHIQSSGVSAWGLHLLQWTSSLHYQDWDTMDIADLKVAMHRLGAVERRLLQAGFPEATSNATWGDALENRGYVSIIKNEGLDSGGSLEHGHQQVIFSNVMPRQMHENLRFEQQQGFTFSDFLLKENPKKLVIRDLGEAVLLVPYFMRRPYNMLLVIKDTAKRYVHQLSDPEQEAAVWGWKLAIQTIKEIMADYSRGVSYNVITHNGPGAGLYFEFLPHTQSNGGFERLGLSICQASPEIAAAQLQEILK